MHAQLLQLLRVEARACACPHCPHHPDAPGDFTVATPRFCELECRLFRELPRLIERACRREAGPDARTDLAISLLHARLLSGLPRA